MTLIARLFVAFPMTESGSLGRDEVISLPAALEARLNKTASIVRGN